MGPLGEISHNVLLGTSILLSIPCVMVVLSAILKAQVSRVLNIIFGIIFTTIMLLTMPGAWSFYIYFGVIEVLLSAAIIWLAWRWPKSIEPCGEK